MQKVAKRSLVLIAILIIVGIGAAAQLMQTKRNQGGSFGKSNIIRLYSPQPGQNIMSPLSIRGEARGNWFFEASFPAVLVNWDGLIIAQGIATAQSDWMTTEFVPFEATLVFTVDKKAFSNRGALILKKDNPSGLPQYDDALEIPVRFAEID